MNSEHRTSIGPDRDGKEKQGSPESIRPSSPACATAQRVDEMRRPARIAIRSVRRVSGCGRTIPV